jgi:hypothetical protein
MLSKKEESILRLYWGRERFYHAIRVTAQGEVQAKQRHDSPWGVLGTAEQAKRSAAELIKRESEYLRWKSFEKIPGRKVRKR